MAQPAAISWQAGTGAIALGCIAFYAKDSLPLSVELALPNGLIMLGLALYWRSVRQLRQLPSRPAALGAVVILATAGVYLFHIPYPDAMARVIIVSLIWIFLMFGSGLALSRSVQGEISGSQRALAWLFYAAALCTTVRLLFLYHAQFDMPAGLDVTDNASWINRLTPLLALALPVLGSTAFVLYNFERMQRQARRQSETLGYITHDLRAPVATVMGYLDLLRPTVTSRQAPHLQAIERSANYQLALIDDILEYSQYELKPLHIEPAMVELPGFIADIARQGQSLCRSRNNVFILRAGTPLPVNILADARRLSQVLLNLIANAATFTQEGEVILAVSARPEATGLALAFVVEDSGPGIAPESHEAVFEAFAQGPSRDGGVGLGLHIARSIVRNMGAELHLASAPGEGARFHFNLRVPALPGDEVFLPAVADDRGSAAIHPSEDQAAPLAIRAQLAALAAFARQGEITRIEQWLADSSSEHPDCAEFLETIEQALERLDLMRIERLASG